MNHPNRDWRHAAAWGLAATYFIATSLGHLEFTLWLLRNRTFMGHAFGFKDAVPALCVAGGLLLAGAVAWQMRERAVRLRVAAFWALWGASVFLVDRFLTFSIYEYAHYPQYALLAILVALCIDRKRQQPGQVLFWATLLGIVDELMQYLWVTPTYGHYLDFNDFLVNLLGAAAGVMLFYGPRRAAAAPASQGLRPEWWVAGGLAALTLALWAGGWLLLRPALGVVVPPGGFAPGPDGGVAWYIQRASDWYGSWTDSRHRGSYFILPPQYGLPLLILLGALFARWSGRR